MLTLNKIVETNRRLVVLLFFISFIAFHTIVLADIKEQTAEEYRVKGYIEHQQGNFNQALTYYSKAVSLGLKNAVIYNDLGVLYEQMGILLRAEQYYLQSLEMDEGYLPAHMNLAYFYQKQGNTEKAIEHFKKRFELADPTDPWAQKAKEELISLDSQYREKAILLEAEKLDEQIVAEAREKLYNNVAYAAEHFQKGQVYFKEGKYEEAIEEFNKALKLTPNNPKIVAAMTKTYYEKGQRHLKKAQHQEAVIAFSQALELEPDNSNIIKARQKAMLDLAKANIRELSEQALKSLTLEDTIAARAEIQKILNEFRNDPVLISKETERLNQQWTENSYDDLDRRVRDSMAFYQKGMGFLEAGEYQQALMEFDHALEKTPQNPKIIRAREEALLGVTKDNVRKYSDEALKRLDSGDTISAKDEIQKMFNTIPPSRSSSEGSKEEKMNQDWVYKAQDEFNYRVEKAIKHYQQGETYLEEGEYEEAIIEYNRALEQTPENPKILKAREKAMLELAKKNIREHSDQAIEMLDSGDAVSARDEIRKILSTIPNESD